MKNEKIILKALPERFKSINSPKEAVLLEIVDSNLSIISHTVMDLVSEYLTFDAVGGSGQVIKELHGDIPREIRGYFKTFMKVAEQNLAEIVYVNGSEISIPITKKRKTSNTKIRKEEIWVVYGYMGKTNLQFGIYRKSSKNKELELVRQFDQFTVYPFEDLTKKDAEDILDALYSKLEYFLNFEEKKKLKKGQITKKKKSLLVFPLVTKGKSSRLSGEGTLAPYYQKYYIGDDEKAYLIREVQKGDFSKVETMGYRVESIFTPPEFEPRNFGKDEKDEAILYLYEQLDTLYSSKLPTPTKEEFMERNKDAKITKVGTFIAYDSSGVPFDENLLGVTLDGVEYTMYRYGEAHEPTEQTKKEFGWTKDSDLAFYLHGWTRKDVTEFLKRAVYGVKYQGHRWQDYFTSS